jgi:DNA-binding response OmpR family regulator
MSVVDSSTAQTPKQRVFVVDDERVIAQTVALILQQSGFNAIAFTNPLHALEAAKSDTPDLLISDVMMPEMSGIDLAIAFRALCPACRILLFSGQSTTSDLLKAAREQGHHFRLLTKPVHPTDLLAAIRSLAPSA